jgi:hypothetical protein
MRTKVIIDGLNNTQKFRAIINGVIIGDNQVKDLMGSRFSQREQRIAVWNALMQVGMQKRHGNETDGYGTNKDGVDVQVNLV